MDNRRRLQKGDVEDMAKQLEDLGYKVNWKQDRIHIFDASGYIGGFYWTPSKGERPGGWRFDVALTRTYSERDFRTAIHELGRLQKIRPALQKAWKAFTTSKSDKRWSSYRSVSYTHLRAHET